MDAWMWVVIAGATIAVVARYLVNNHIAAREYELTMSLHQEYHRLTLGFTTGDDIKRAILEKCNTSIEEMMK